MRYDKIRFIKGLSGEFYREIDSSGTVLRHLDMDGKPIEIPPVTESYISDIDPPRPAWALDDVVEQKNKEEIIEPEKPNDNCSAEG